MVVVVVLEVLEDGLDVLVHLVDERLLSGRIGLLQKHADLLHVLLHHGREGLLVQGSVVGVLHQAIRDFTPFPRTCGSGRHRGSSRARDPQRLP